MEGLVKSVVTDPENLRESPDMSCKGVFGELLDFNSKLFEKCDVWSQFEKVLPENGPKDTSGVQVMLLLWYFALSNVLDTTGGIETQM